MAPEKRVLTHTGKLDFYTFQMDCGITERGESVILQQSFVDVFGKDYENFIQAERFEPFRTEELHDLLATPLHCKRHGQVKIAYHSQLLNLFSAIVLCARMEGMMESPEDKKITEFCIAIAKKIIPRALQAYEAWKRQIESN